MSEPKPPRGWLWIGPPVALLIVALTPLVLSGILLGFVWLASALEPNSGAGYLMLMPGLVLFAAAAVGVVATIPLIVWLLLANRAYSRRVDALTPTADPGPITTIPVPAGIVLGGKR